MPNQFPGLLGIESPDLANFVGNDGIAAKSIRNPGHNGRGRVLNHHAYAGPPVQFTDPDADDAAQFHERCLVGSKHLGDR